jgi:serine/threonine protein kinase
MWSFGILLYELAVAYKPTAIKNYRYSPGDDIPFWSSDWKKRGQRRSLQDLIKGCLTYNPKKRITAGDAL